MHLVHHAIFYALDQGARFVLLGSTSDPEIAGHFWHLKQHLNDHPDVHLELQFSVELAHLVYAGSDLLVMPSNFEPCGLVQLVALKYGTVPIVRSVGGLADTVTDRDHAPTPPSNAPATSFTTTTTRRSNPRWHARSDCGTPTPRTSAT